MNKFLNNKKAIEFGNKFWDRTQECGLINITAKNLGHGKLMVSGSGHVFVNMCSYSYLGLDSHPLIIEGAIEGIKESNTLNSSISRVRVGLEILKETENLLSNLFGAEAIIPNPIYNSIYLTLQTLLIISGVKVLTNPQTTSSNSRRVL